MRVCVSVWALGSSVLYHMGGYTRSLVVTLGNIEGSNVEICLVKPYVLCVSAFWMKNSNLCFEPPGPATLEGHFFINS